MIAFYFFFVFSFFRVFVIGSVSFLRKSECGSLSCRVSRICTARAAFTTPPSLAGFVLSAGAILFAGDLSARAFLGARLFPYAAPIGGSLMILAWLALALAFALAPRPPQP